METKGKGTISYNIIKGSNMWQMELKLNICIWTSYLKLLTDIQKRVCSIQSDNQNEARAKTDQDRSVINLNVLLRSGSIKKYTKRTNCEAIIQCASRDYSEEHFFSTQIESNGDDPFQRRYKRKIKMDKTDIDIEELNTPQKLWF